MGVLDRAARVLAESGFEPLPTQRDGFTLKFLSATEAREASLALRGIPGLFLSVEGVDDEDEHVDEAVFPAGSDLSPEGTLPRGYGYHITVFPG